MHRTSTSHVCHEQTCDPRALASPALVTSACLSLVHVSVPFFP